MTQLLTPPRFFPIDGARALAPMAGVVDLLSPNPADAGADAWPGDPLRSPAPPLSVPQAAKRAAGDEDEEEVEDEDDKPDADEEEEDDDLDDDEDEEDEDEDEDEEDDEFEDDEDDFDDDDDDDDDFDDDE